jgi:NodT family efflux transporter outer membrane factor (OMF) lipoprotein
MRRRSSATLVVAGFAALLFLSGCLATKPYEAPAPETDGLYGSQPVALDSATLAEVPWQEVFEDSTLRGLIDEALRNNLDLRDAVQQVRVAEANLQEAEGALLPDLFVGGTASYSEPSDNGAAGAGRGAVGATDQYSASVSTSWEVDVWGRLTSAKKAQRAALFETEATRRAVQTAVVANVARAYYQLLALDRQLSITNETVETRAADLKTVRALKEGGVVTNVAVQRSRASLEAARASVHTLQQAITERENALSILLGRAPGPVERTSLSAQSPIDSLAAGVPGQLLRNRPDVIAAEYRYRSAFELTNSARAAFYPSLTVTADGGLESLNVSDLLTPGSLFYNLIGGVTQPIFAQNRNEARLKRRTARQVQARLGLRRALLTAGSEVSNALSRYRNAAQRLEARRAQLTALDTAVAESRELLRYGEETYLQVLTAQQDYLAAQLDVVDDRLQRLLAGVELYRALGGGWDRSENPIRAESIVREKSASDNE